MLRSVDKRRDIDARFYKPVCLLAVIDGIADGTLAPSDISLDQACTRFDKYLSDIVPARASMGWRPLWHLSRDGAWIFSQDGKVVGPEDFGRERKPNSRRELSTNVDLIAVPESLRKFWHSPADREELRTAVLSMLFRDDETCRLIAAKLAPPSSTVPAFEREEVNGGEILRHPGVAETSRQGFIASALARKTIEMRAMLVVAEHLTRDGWLLTDVSSKQSYDFHCRKGGQVKYIEVKGTTGSGQQVQITAAELAFAQTHEHEMVLAIVANIQIQEKDDGALEATGGSLRLIEKWAPQPDCLLPISFFYKVPA